MLSAQTQRSLTIPPNAAFFDVSHLTLGTYRVEFRLEGVQPNTSDDSQYIWGNGDWPSVSCRVREFSLNGGLKLSCEFGGDGQAYGGPALILQKGQDIRLRFQREPAAKMVTLEAWNGDCTGYGKQQYPITVVAPPVTVKGPMRLNVAHGKPAAPKITLGFLRFYSTTDYSGACPVDAPAEAADMADFRFDEDSLADASGNRYQITPGGSAFQDSVLYKPHAAITGSGGYKFVVTAGSPFTLDGASSVAFSGDGTPESYLWEQLSGPGTSTFSSPNDAETSVTAAAFGQYVYRLTVTDAHGNASSADQIVGVVETNADGTVKIANPDMAWILGPLIPWGTSPWPWYEITSAATADVLADSIQAPPAIADSPWPGSTLSAMVPPNVVSDGFVTASGSGGVILTGTGTNFDPTWEGRYIYITWDADGDGSNQGRRALYIRKVLDDTHIVVNDYYLPEPPAALTDMDWGVPASPAGLDPGYNVSSQAAVPWNVYEAGLGMYRMYHRSGLDAYLDAAHAFCDNWYRYALDSGYGSPIPRNFGMQFMLACGSDPSWDQPPGFWDNVAALLKRSGGSWINPPALSKEDLDRTFDGREVSYLTRYTALIAKLYPRHSRNPAGARTAWCGALVSQINNIWSARETQLGNASYFGESQIRDHTQSPAASHPAGDPNASYGTSPWRVMGLSTLMLTYAYSALRDPLACDEQGLADYLFDPATHDGLIPRAAQFVWDYGRSPDAGLYYNVMYESMQGTLDGTVVQNMGSMDPSAAIHVQKGSTSVVGTHGDGRGAHGSHFLRQFGPCDGSTGIQIHGTSYTVRSCDDWHLTLGTAYAGATEAAVSDFTNPQTLDLTAGSTTIAGHGTKFRAFFGPCDGSTYIALMLPRDARGQAQNYVYQVVACTDTTLTINYPFQGPTYTGLSNFAITGRAYASCGPLSISSYCEPDPWSGRNLSMDIAASAAWLYNETGEADWQARAEWYLNKTFGGAAGGAGSLGPPAGTCSEAGNVKGACADGGTGNLADILPLCGVSPVPCGSGAIDSKHGKPFGMSDGAGDVPNAMAYIGGMVPVDSRKGAGGSGKKSGQ